MKKYVNTIVLIPLVILISGCITNPSKCPETYIPLDNLNATISNNNEAFNAIYNHIESGNASNELSRRIKDVSEINLDNIIIKDISTYIFNNATIVEISVWEITEKVAIDENGLIHGRQSC